MMSRKMLMGLGVGAALAYLASPQSRRNQMRDQVKRAGQQARDAFDKVRRGLPSRVSAMRGNTQAHWSSSLQGVSSR
jgi:uncharacterized membrane protein YccC